MYQWRQIMVKKPLSNSCEGENGNIVQIRGKPAMHRYLYDMGLTVGRSISVKKVEATPLDTSVTVTAGDRIVTLSNKLALNIQVEIPIAIDERVIPDLPREYSRLYQVTGINR